MHQAMKILDAKAAVHKFLDELQNIPAWQESQVKSKQEVIHFTTFMDMRHSKTQD